MESQIQGVRKACGAEGTQRRGSSLEILRSGNSEATWVVCFRPEGPASAYLTVFPLTRYSSDLGKQLLIPSL